MENLLKRDESLYQNLNKSFKRDSGTREFQKKVACFHEHSASCCLMLLPASATLQNAGVLWEKRFQPPKEFLEDQRKDRKMVIGPVDKKTTAVIRKREERKASEDRWAQKRSHGNDGACSSSAIMTSDSDDADDFDSGVKDGDFSPVALDRPDRPQIRAKMPKLTSFARKCDRYGIGDRAAAFLASFLLQDLSMAEQASSDETSGGTSKGILVIDRNKVRRERAVTRFQITEQQNQDDSLQALFFDGREDSTLTIETLDDNSKHRRLVGENHISLVKQPGDEYYGHVTSVSHTAEDEFESIWAHLSGKPNVETSTLEVVGCDGAPTNTGKHAGIIRRFEEKLGKPLLWDVCQLHSNELPLHHIIQEIDGATTGPTGFSGLIGRLLGNCETLPVQKFTAIPCELPAVDRDKLSTEQAYLFDMCRAVSCGVVPEELANRSPGKMHHARWVTTGNHILRLYIYISTKKPSSQLSRRCTLPAGSGSNVRVL